MAQSLDPKNPYINLPSIDSELRVPKNATPSYLIDEVGRIRRAMKWLEKVDKFYSTALKTRMGNTLEVTGDEFEGKLLSVTQMRISSELVRELFTPEEVAKVEQAVTFDALYVKPLKVEEEKAKPKAKGKAG